MHHIVGATRECWLSANKAEITDFEFQMQVSMAEPFDIKTAKTLLQQEKCYKNRYCRCFFF